ncbi:unnamed protein product [Symbiodinium sp. CCMP2592]|nr:unnamed protein product [Symbiodinium sp. CCMP2592]
MLAPCTYTAVTLFLRAGGHPKTTKYSTSFRRMKVSHRGICLLIWCHKDLLIVDILVIVDGFVYHVHLPCCSHLEHWVTWWRLFRMVRIPPRWIVEYLLEKLV